MNFRRWPIVVVAAVAACSGPPPGYLEACDRESACDAPLQCLQSTESVDTFCTIPCTTDDECAELTGSGCFFCDGGACGGSKCI